MKQEVSVMENVGDLCRKKERGGRNSCEDALVPVSGVEAVVLAEHLTT